MNLQNIENTIFYLIGFAGSGKYTIAREICDLANVRLVDNHLINNPVFSLINADGKTPLPSGVWDHALAIRNIVFDVMRNMSPPEYSFALTNCLRADDEIDQKLYEGAIELAHVRGADFRPVRLFLTEEELIKRRTSPSRAQRFKDISAENARREYHEQRLIDISHENLIDIEVSDLSARDAAMQILSALK